jgi:CTP-dependent riboflavin kinase
MGARILSGHVMRGGFGDASNWGLAEIREVTGYSLLPGTLNVKLNAPHKIRSDFRLLRERRTDRRPEDLDFERCRLVMEHGTVRALIARTSTNAWGDEVLEIMAEKHLRSCYGLKDLDQISVEIWVGADSSAEAEAECIADLGLPNDA